MVEINYKANRWKRFKEIQEKYKKEPAKVSIQGESISKEEYNNLFSSNCKCNLLNQTFDANR